ETALLGLRSNRAALINILTNSAFEAGTATTGLLDDLFNGPGCLPHGGEASPQFRAVAVALMVRLQADQARARSIGIAPDLIGWSNTGPRDFLRRYRIGDYEGPMLVKTEGTDIVVTEEAFSLGFMGPDEQMITNPISWADASAAVVAKADRRLVSAQATNADITETRVSLQIDGAKVHAVLNGLQALTYCYAVGPDGTLYLQEMGGEAPGWDVRETTFDRPRRPTEADLKTTKIKAPMYGVLVTLDVAEGDIVKGWSRIAVVEAMKMRHNLGIAGEGRGRVTRINAAVGDQVALDQVIAEIEKIPPEEDPDATGP
ncbi:MAG: biotin/lipoyl-containing protein, partial [Pseudomonadota bacterium]